MRACGNPQCHVSTAISGHITFGSGELDEFGFWENECRECASAFEFGNPEYNGQVLPALHPDFAVLLENDSIGG